MLCCESRNVRHTVGRGKEAQMPPVQAGSVAAPAAPKAAAHSLLEWPPIAKGAMDGHST